MGDIAAKLIVLSFVIMLAILAYSPLRMIRSYFILRPLVQPFSFLKYTLFKGMPLTGAFSFILIPLSLMNALFVSSNKVFERNISLLYFIIYFAAFSFLDSISISMSMSNYSKILMALSVYLIVYNNIKREDDIKKFLYSYVVCSILPMLYGYYQYITGTGHAYVGEYYDGNRIDSFLGEYNAYGEFLSILICSALIIINKSSAYSRVKCVLLVAASLVLSLMLSLNRGSWISLTLGILVSCLCYRKYINLKLVLAGFLVTLLVFSPIIVYRFHDLNAKSEFGNSKNTLQGRVDYWKKAVVLVEKRPFLGYGIGTIFEIADKYLNTSEVPHNDYLLLALEAGIPSSLAYLLFILHQIWVFFRRRKNKALFFINFPLLALCIYWAVISNFQNIIYNQTVFPMFLALIALGHKANHLQRSETPVTGGAEYVGLAK